LATPVRRGGDELAENLRLQLDCAWGEAGGEGRSGDVGKRNTAGEKRFEGQVSAREGGVGKRKSGVGPFCGGGTPGLREVDNIRGRSHQAKKKRKGKGSRYKNCGRIKRGGEIADMTLF